MPIQALRVIIAVAPLMNVRCVSESLRTSFTVQRQLDQRKTARRKPKKLPPVTRELNKVYSLFFVVGLFGVDGHTFFLDVLPVLMLPTASMAVAMEWSMLL